ncbi:MAG: tyrosine-type recombinase/integrase [Planktomarina sp.]
MRPPIKIAKRTVDALKPESRRYVVNDTDLKGFCVRVSPGGGKVYGFRYRAGGGRAGRSRWLTIGTHGTVTPHQARATAQSWAAVVVSGGDPAADRDTARDAPYVSDLMARYLREHVEVKNKLSTGRNVKQQIRASILPALGKIKVAEVTSADISKLHASLSKSPIAANRTLATLSKAFELAEVWNYRAEHSNPCKKVQGYAETPRDRYLTQSEFSKLGQVLVAADKGPIPIEGRAQPVQINPQAILAIRLLILTGARTSEILGLQWPMINWNAGRAELPDSKSNRPKHIILPPPALVLLNGIERPVDGLGYVVRGGKEASPARPLVNLKDPWKLICKAASIEDMRLHDLRHSFASVGASGNMGLPILGALLGHSNPSTTARYAHLADDPKQAAAGKISGEIDAMMNPQNAGEKVINIDKWR